MTNKFSTFYSKILAVIFLSIFAPARHNVAAFEGKDWHFHSQMASLRSYLPPAGGSVWRNERTLTRTSSSGEAECRLSRTKIKHIVIREVWKRDVPSSHALYKIDVMTQSNHWFILRRYREFHSLHVDLVQQYNIPSDMLPTKKLFSNMSLGHLEKRRNALEHYLQRLINSFVGFPSSTWHQLFPDHHDIAESQELFQFLNVQTHDVLCVTRQLAKVLEKEGRNILASGGIFTFSPTQMYCITRQLQLPHMAIEESDTSNPGDNMVDLGHLYGFIQELESLCVSGVSSRSSPCQELISNQAFDISLFKSLTKLQIEKCHISVIDGLFRIQKQLTHVTLSHCLSSMKEFLVDCAMQKRAIKQASSNVESWRNMSTTKLTDNRVVVRPWVLLTHINMSHNNISTLDHSLKLLPSLEQLDLSHNEFVHLDLEQLTSSTLTFLNLSYNQIHYVSATSRDLRNLKSLLLTNNKLQNLDGIECLRGLVELDVRHNDVKAIEELVKISSLLHLRILALTGNPCVAAKSYRIKVFCQLKARELILDGIKITEIEKAKVNLFQGRKISNTDSGHTPKHSLSSVPQTQVNQDMKKNFPPYRDDDQDSGFGGNYTGSVDEGGLVFDWSCYSNHLDVLPETFQCQIPGPNTSRSMLRSPPPSIRSSRGEINQRNNKNAVSKSENDNNVLFTTNDAVLNSKSRHGTENVLLERGKQPLNKRNVKRNTKFSVSAPSTLLQISLNGKTSEISEVVSHANKQDMNDGICDRDNTISIQNSTKTIHDDVDNCQDNTETFKHSSNTRDIGQCPLKDNLNPDQDTDAEVSKGNVNHHQDSVNSVHGDSVSIQDTTNLGKDNTNSIVKNTDFSQNSTNLAHDKTNSIGDKTDLSQDSTNFVHDNTNYIVDKTDPSKDCTSESSSPFYEQPQTIDSTNEINEVT